MVRSQYPIEWVRYGSAAMMEWIHLIACMIPVDFPNGDE